MKNLLQLFLQYGGFFVFLVLEIVCFFLIIQYNQRQKAIYASSTQYFGGYISEKVDDVTKHFALSEYMDSIARQNANFQEILFNEGLTKKGRLDSVKNGRQKYQVVHAEVIRNSVKNNHNYLILNKGKLDGIEPHTAVIDGKGVIGIVRGVSDHYADVMSLLHRQTRVSASIKGSNQYGGSLVWRGFDPFEVELDNIPKYLSVSVGDTVVTSGDSFMFPQDIMIGTVASQYIPEGSSSHEIKVKLHNNIGNAKYVYVVKNLDKIELETLQATVEDE